MRRVVALGCAVLLTSISGVTRASANEEPLGKYIVVLRDDVTDARAVAAEHGRRHHATVSLVYSHALDGYAATIPASEVVAIEKDPRVAYIAEDEPVWTTGKATEPQVLPGGVDRVDGELSLAQSGDGSGSVDVDIAILDAGFHLGHPDLNLLPGAICNETSFEPKANHGTHVAGILGAKDNDFGVVGVAPGARVWAVKVLREKDGGALVSQIVCGIDWVTANADIIEVANMSLGGGGSDDGRCGRINGDPMHQAICASVAAGVTYVVSAGNVGRDSANFRPASYDEVLTVSALADYDGQPGGLARPTCKFGPDDTLATFSNFGPDVDFIAPGACVLSTWGDDAYDTATGTSMAAPHVAGAAALYKSSHASARPSLVRKALLDIAVLNWDSSTDPDGIKEPLLNVTGL